MRSGGRVNDKCGDWWGRACRAAECDRSTGVVAICAGCRRRRRICAWEGSRWRLWLDTSARCGRCGVCARRVGRRRRFDCCGRRWCVKNCSGCYCNRRRCRSPSGGAVPAAAACPRYHGKRRSCGRQLREGRASCHRCSPCVRGAPPDHAAPSRQELRRGRDRVQLWIVNNRAHERDLPLFDASWALLRHEHYRSSVHRSGQRCVATALFSGGRRLTGQNGARSSSGDVWRSRARTRVHSRVLTDSPVTGQERQHVGACEDADGVAGVDHQHGGSLV
jgi:hypothetical protein